MVIAPHPDDETLGCAGTILNHIDKGDDVFWLIVTNISASEGWELKKVQQRQAEIDNISKLYKFTNTWKLDFPTTKLDVIPISTLIESISRKIIELQPEVIYINNRCDVHTDHQIVFKAAMSCTKSFRYPSVKRILMYEVLSETEFSAALPETQFIPNVFIDITQFMGKKLDIMKTYKSELSDDFSPRSISTIEALNRFRGSRIGVEYAEAFMLIYEEIR